MDLMIHKFQTSAIFGDAEEYEEHTDITICMQRVKTLAAEDDGFEYWAEDADGNIYAADEPCGYCGPSKDPNEMCISCFSNLN